MIWNELWVFIKRNILAIVLAMTIAIAAPWTLIFIIPVAIISLLPLLIKWRLYRAQQQMFDNASQQGGNPFSAHTHSAKGGKRKSEGEVTVVQTEQTEQRVNDDVGEYVDFKEIKDNK